MKIIDLYPIGVDPAGHARFSSDCPCRPWLTYRSGEREVRHTPDLAPPRFANTGQPCGGTGCAGVPPYCPDCEAEVEAFEADRWADYYSMVGL